MKAIVEWGRPKQETARKICGLSGSYIVANAKQANILARQVFHPNATGFEPVGDWRVTPENPRAVTWNADNTFWVAVSLLDGIPRGPYSGEADRDYMARTARNPLE